MAGPLLPHPVPAEVFCGCASVCPGKGAAPALLPRLPRAAPTRFTLQAPAATGDNTHEGRVEIQPESAIESSPGRGLGRGNPVACRPPHNPGPGQSGGRVGTGRVAGPAGGPGQGGNPVSRSVPDR